MSADVQYFDLTVSNAQGEQTKPIVFNYNQARSTPFLQNPNEYFMSIIRFSADTNTMPVIIPTIKANSPDRDDTIYSVTLEYDTYAVQKYIQWVPQDKEAEIPRPPSENYNGLQNNTTGYYNCGDYSFFVLQMYRTLQQAYDELVLLTGLNGITLPSSHPPLVNWDSTLNQLVLYADVEGYDLNPDLLGYVPIKLYFNTPLYNFFNTVPGVLQGYTVPTLGRNFLVGFSNVGGTNLQSIIPPNTTTSYRAIVVYQEASTTSNMSPIVGVVFTSTTLPIQSSQVSAPIVYYNGLPSQVGTSNDIQNVITDLITDDLTYRSTVVYNPSAQYRLVQLYGSQPLVNLDMQLYFRLKDGTLQPLLIGLGGCVTVKICFMKKYMAFK